ncbi:MAG: hypothetical protein KC636_16520 [Myxococcales bacterium]|nr:hypothetical protein [Myxococcales bacterium]
MSTHDWIAAAEARLRELAGRRQQYAAVLESVIDPRNTQAITSGISRVDRESQHISEAIALARQESGAEGDDEVRTIEREEDERPTAHWDPDAVVGPSGQTMAQALAEIRGGPGPAPSTHEIPRQRPNETGDALWPPSRELWSTHRQSTLVVGFLLAFATTAVIMYALIN